MNSFIRSKAEFNMIDDSICNFATCCHTIVMTYIYNKWIFYAIYSMFEISFIFQVNLRMDMFIFIIIIPFIINIYRERKKNEKELAF